MRTSKTIDGAERRGGRRPRGLRFLAYVVTGALFGMAVAGAARAAVDESTALLRAGRYAEARKSFERTASRDPVGAALGIARCADAVGELDVAVRTLSEAAKKHPESAALPAELARLEFGRGNYSAAQALVDSALRIDPDQPAARYFAAELDRVAGKLEQANEAYLWLVHFYNRDQDAIHDSDVLRWIGLAGAQNARWNRNSGQFHFLANTLYPDILQSDSTYWPAHLEEARLFIEKYNLSDAADELNAGLALNPNAAELHAARAQIALQRFDLDSVRTEVDRALAINPRLVWALQLGADVRMVTGATREAATLLERARGLNPTDEETLGRLAAVYGAIDGLEGPPGSRMGAVVAEAVKRNEHCGAFFAALASSLDLMQKYPPAARFYEQAQTRMPQLVSAPGQLGLVYMRLGEEDKARETLQHAFEIDPFNVRVKNSIQVLDVLQSYGRIETPHFTIRFDLTRDSLLARYASRYLEQDVYPWVVKELGYEPPGKSLFEIFSSAKGSSGHSWFSTRMVGLPFIGTVGACAGKMVAIASPNDGRLRFNWARVLKHEFVHVVNLQQTHFNIPRWYTEALAVRAEWPTTPPSWDPILARRAAADSLFDLGTIQLGFVRPQSGEDWALAYCQAELYARYMASRGDDALRKMIAAYGDNLDTSGALRRCFGEAPEAFESGYRKYLADVVAGIEKRKAVARADSAALAKAGRADTVQALVRKAESDADDLAPRLELAKLADARNDWEQAGKWAVEVMHIDVTAPDAHAILGRSMAERKQYAPAVEEYETAITLNDQKPEWRFALAKACIAAGRKDRARRVLDELLLRDPKYPGARELRDGLAAK